MSIKKRTNFPKFDEPAVLIALKWLMWILFVTYGLYLLIKLAHKI